jgi:hypothetical protein
VLNWEGICVDLPILVSTGRGACLFARRRMLQPVTGARRGFLCKG